MASDLKKAYKEIRWVGNFPDLPKDTSVFFYLNHQHYFDGHLVWLLGWKVFKRKFWVWMQEWDRFPFLRLFGALPFPQNDIRKRIQVMQFTKSELEKCPSDVYFFPEAVLHSPAEDLLPFPPRIFERMNALTHHKVWIPIAAKAVVTADARPILYVSSGAPHRQIDGTEQQRLAETFKQLNDLNQPTTLIFQGTANPDSQLNFGFLKRFFDV